MSRREKIEAIIQDCVGKLAKEIRAAAHEAVDAAMADDDGESPEVAPPKKPRKTLRAARAVRALPPPASSGGVTVADVVGVVKAHPGCNGGTIVKELGKPRWSVLKPIAEALATGKIRKSGSGRGLSYTAGR